MEQHTCTGCDHHHHETTLAPVPGDKLEDLLVATIPSGSVRFISLFADNDKLYNVPVPSRYPDGLLEHVGEIFSSSTPGFFFVAASLPAPSHDLGSLVQQLPFLKILFALAHLGHRIVIHNGKSEHLNLIARDADVIIADELHRPNLSPEFRTIVTSVAESAEFYVCGHTSQTLNEWDA